MNQEFRHFTTIFGFTFREHMKGKKYRNTTIWLGIIFLLLPAIILTLVAFADGKEKKNKQSLDEIQTSIETVIVVDLLEGETVDYSQLNSAGSTVFSKLSYESAESTADAEKMASSNGHALILVLEKKNGSSYADLLLPDKTELKKEDAENYEEFLQKNQALLLLEKSGISQEALQKVSVPVQGTVLTADANSENEMEQIQSVFKSMLPYLSIMILYFCILAYGQGVATSVIMEKSSKLVDTFLVSVRPGAMILGKILAIASCALIQLGVWILALVISFIVGCKIAGSIEPDMLILQFLKGFGQISGTFFTPVGIVLAILITISGFLLYCSLAAIGGAAASKPEDLSTTNVLFTMILVVSFLTTLMGGAMEGTLGAASWQVYVPFTGMLITPSLVLVGDITWVHALISLLISVASMLAVSWLAGKIYRMLILYKGDPMSPAKVFEMMKQKK